MTLRMFKPLFHTRGIIASRNRNVKKSEKFPNSCLFTPYSTPENLYFESISGKIITKLLVIIQTLLRIEEFIVHTKPKIVSNVSKPLMKFQTFFKI